MRFNGRRIDEKSGRFDQEDEQNEMHFKKVKKERREKYKVKNQKFHQLDYTNEDFDEDFEF